MIYREGKKDLNVPGKYYVNGDCLDCTICTDIVPSNFDRDDSFGSFVKKQPTSLEENILCEQAKLDCPIGAICDNGKV